VTVNDLGCCFFDFGVRRCRLTSLVVYLRLLVLLHLLFLFLLASLLLFYFFGLVVVVVLVFVLIRRFYVLFACVLASSARDFRMTSSLYFGAKIMAAALLRVVGAGAGEGARLRPLYAPLQALGSLSVTAATWPTHGRAQRWAYPQCRPAAAGLRGTAKAASTAGSLRRDEQLRAAPAVRPLSGLAAGTVTTPLTGLTVPLATSQVFSRALATRRSTSTAQLCL